MVLLAMGLAGCRSQPEVINLSGEAMGTSYNIVVLDRDGSLEPAAVQAAVESTIDTVNAQMSNWDPDSEISQFNETQSTDPIEISDDLAEVMAIANEVHELSEGQFDVTLGPLIELWGFGARNAESPVPADAAIAAAMEVTGQLEVLSFGDAPTTMAKAFPDTNVFLAAIAKGYGVDQIGATLEGLGVEDYLVEIGGDLVTSGNNPDGRPWRIGIERPDPSSESIEQLVEISGLGMATSGDYRNFFEEDGVRYSHIIDAQTGRPITHNTASVTVLAEDAARADAWATALLVLGAERGLEISENLDLAVFFIVRDTNSEEIAFSTLASSAFQELQAEE